MPQQAGETILASDIVPVRVYKKAATESRTAVTMVNDADFVLLPFAANKTFNVRVLLATANTTSATGDIAVQFVMAGGLAQLTSRANIGPGTADTTPAATGPVMNRTNVTTSQSFGAGFASAASAHIEMEFIVETTTAGTAGTLTMQWGLVSASGTTQVLSSSVIIVQEVEMQ